MGTHFLQGVEPSVDPFVAPPCLQDPRSQGPPDPSTPAPHTCTFQFSTERYRRETQVHQYMPPRASAATVRIGMAPHGPAGCEQVPHQVCRHSSLAPIPQPIFLHHHRPFLSSQHPPCSQQKHRIQIGFFAGQLQHTPPPCQTQSIRPEAGTCHARVAA